MATPSHVVVLPAAMGGPGDIKERASQALSVTIALRIMI